MYHCSVIGYKIMLIGGRRMVLTNEIKGRIVAKGLTQADIAKILGISTKTFNSKLNGKGTLDVNDIEKLIEILDIKNPMEIFFAKHVS